MMSETSVLTRLDYEDQFIYYFFGRVRNPLLSCIRRAYRDFSRTLRGIQKFESETASGIVRQAEILLLVLIPSVQTVSRQEEFDQWHESLCAALAELYRQNGFPAFYMGQAQKWINMTLKYVFTFGERYLPGYENIYAFCHVPIDSIMYNALEKYGVSRVNNLWSRINSYTDYLGYQIRIRETFPFAIPLDVEFFLWMGKDIARLKDRNDA